MPASSMTLLTPNQVCTALALHREDGSPDTRALARLMRRVDAPRVVWITARIWRMPQDELDAFIERNRGSLSLRAERPNAEIPNLVKRRRRASPVPARPVPNARARAAE